MEIKMPFVHIRLQGKKLDEKQMDQMHRDATNLMVDIMGKKGELTSVLIEQIVGASWSVGGKTAPIAAHLEVAITRGTNSPDQKAKFVREASDLLRRAGGSLPLATYVVIREISGDAWGYDGLTQEDRKQLIASA
jgi:4-oxalocrotonate tautomerase